MQSGGILTTTDHTAPYPRVPTPPSHPSNPLRRYAQSHARRVPRPDTHDRIRHDRVDKAGSITLDWP